MESIKIVKTSDGSNTLYSERYKAHYHSLNGALQESLHIFIRNGFEYLELNEITLLEVGFGTGLNAALTASKACELNRKTNYFGVELFPLEESILSKIDYESVISGNESDLWKKINAAEWGKEELIAKQFSITKLHTDICKVHFINYFDLIYFDAFAPEDQPELWGIEIFEKLFRATNQGGVLVTYCSKGIVKQALRNVGYKVERLSGPPGKRHILRAIKP